MRAWLGFRVGWPDVMLPLPCWILPGAAGHDNVSQLSGMCFGAPCLHDIRVIRDVLGRWVRTRTQLDRRVAPAVLRAALRRAVAKQHARVVRQASFRLTLDRGTAMLVQYVSVVRLCTS